MSSPSHIICVIDFENLHIPCERASGGSFRDALINIPVIMAAVSAVVGMPHVVRAYAPWHAYRAYQRPLDGAGVERIDVTTKSDATIHRNAADLRIAIDVMDYIHDHPGCTVVIVGGDGGYTFLAMTCRRHGCQVHVLAYPKTLAETLERAATSVIPWPAQAAPVAQTPTPIPQVQAPVVPVQALRPAPVPAPVVSSAPKPAPVRAPAPSVQAGPVVTPAPTPKPLTPEDRRRLIRANMDRNMALAARVAEAKAASLQARQSRAAVSTPVPQAQPAVQAQAQASAPTPTPMGDVPIPKREDVITALVDLGAGHGPCPVRDVISAMRQRGSFRDDVYAGVPMGRVFSRVDGVRVTRDGTRTMLSVA